MMKVDMKTMFRFIMKLRIEKRFIRGTMKIASVLTADFANLENELASIKSADLLHLDIMDGT